MKLIVVKRCVGTSVSEVKVVVFGGRAAGMGKCACREQPRIFQQVKD